jgi:hypothetical protein
VVAAAAAAGRPHATMSYAQAIGAMPSKEDRNYIDPNSKFCRWCRKRFANENVYKAHLEGKKHLKALEAGGRKAEADAIRRRLADAKKMAAAKKAQEVAAVELQEAATKKRKQAEDPVAGEDGGGSSAEPEGAKKVGGGGGCARRPGRVGIGGRQGESVRAEGGPERQGPAGSGHGVRVRHGQADGEHGGGREVVGRHPALRRGPRCREPQQRGVHERPGRHGRQPLHADPGPPRRRPRLGGG